jgi:SAM-dependent methyltransferase
MEGKEMKVRESGMPGVEMWQTFFDPESILDVMGLTGDVCDAVDFGCGYGTFSIPAAKRIQGTLHGFDIDPAMIKACKLLAKQKKARNVRLHLGDFVKRGTGLDAASVDYVMLFNILHAKDPLRLLREAWRILVPGGHAGVIHWNYDPKTPRGPPMSIRPRPKQCIEWGKEAGFRFNLRDRYDLPPYHYGLLFRKPLRNLALDSVNRRRNR